jgi:hypothetical protein
MGSFFHCCVPKRWLVVTPPQQEDEDKSKSQSKIDGAQSIDSSSDAGSDYEKKTQATTSVDDSEIKSDGSEEDEGPLLSNSVKGAKRKRQ